MNQISFYDISGLRLSRKTRKALFLVATMATVFSLNPALQAQEETEEEEEMPVFELGEFIVTSGIRDSLAAGIEIKQQNVQLVDAIVAEDIGKFPDNNTVEALQRVPGIQVTDRARGEVNVISIRGLNDITTTINGRNIFTASGRAVALADIPASLLHRVDVYKTRSASLIEHGIAGVIDVKTQRPFYFGGPRTVLTGRYVYTELSESWDPHLSALVSNVWETKYGRFGALLNVAYDETDWSDKSITSGAMVPFVTENPPPGWVPFERIFPSDGRVEEDPVWQPGLEDGLPFEPGSTLTMNGNPVPYYLARDAVFTADFYGHRERPAVNLSLQFAPDEKSQYTFEAFYNGYREEWFNNLMFSFADWWGSLGDNPLATTGFIPGTNIMKERSIFFPYGFTSGDFTDQQTDSYLYALSGEWGIGEDLHIKADLAYQESEFETKFFAMRTDRVTYNIVTDFNDHDGIPAWTFNDDPATPDVDESDMTDPAQWNIAQLYDNAARNEGEALSLTVDGDYQTGWEFIDMIQFGIRYDDRDASEGERTQDAPGLGQPLSNYPELQYLNKGYFDGEADIPMAAVVPDARYIFNNAEEIRSLYKSTVAPDLLLRDDLAIVDNFNITEKTYAAYAQADFQTEVGDTNLRGQFGVRYVEVETDIRFGEDSADRSTDKLLPSIALAWDITPQWRIRASYGETLRRPDFVDLNPNIIYVEDVTNIGYGTATGGNPDLDATESRNYDLSLEYYFGEVGLAYVTAFRREIDGLVVDFRRRVTYEDYDYILTQPDNTSNGELEGLELGFTWFPDNLPDLLDGLGVQASYTILDSVQDIPVTNDAGEVVGTDTTPFFAVSDKSYSVVLAYEKPRYSARLSYVWRDDFLNNYEAALFANPLGVYRTAQKSLDLQLTFRVTDNFTLTFDATNLTDEIYHSYYEYPQTHNFGNWLISRTFAVGARYSF